MNQQELVTIPRASALEVFTTQGAIDPLLARVRERIDNFTADASTTKGRAEIRTFAHSIVKTKAAMEAVGKGLADEQKLIPKKIDESRRMLRETLDGWHDEVRKPLTDFETAEAARVAHHKAEIARLIRSPSTVSSAAEIRECLAGIEAIAIGPELEEFVADYAQSKDAAVRELRSKLAERERLDAEQAELTRLRREAEEQAARDRDERIRAAAAEAERERAEQAAAAELQRVEREAAAATARAEAQAQAERDAAARREQELRDAAEAERRRAEDAERRAAEAERRAKDEAKAKADRIAAEARRREEDAKRRTKVEGAAVAALVAGGIDEAVAHDVVALIARRAVPHVSIAY